MKSNVQPTLYFSMHTQHSLNAESRIKNKQSPYLRAILSRKGGSGKTGSIRSLNADRQAAIRYIQESKRNGK